jgi:Mg2+-importing ATPase
MIPADCRVLVAKDLFVAQSAMTGESLPVEKYAIQKDQDAINPLDLENILFMGTNVVSGSATAVVLTTGGQTYFGALAKRITASEQVTTSFQLGVNKVSWLLIRFMAVMAPLFYLLMVLPKATGQKRVSLHFQLLSG